MKKMIRKLSLVLALVLALSVCCATAEVDTTQASGGMDIMSMMGMMQYMPGLENIDWEGYYAGLQERAANGEELTLQDMLPDEAWTAFGALMGGEDEEAPYTIALTVDGDVMVQTYTFKEQINEDDAAQVVDSVKESFESMETKKNMKESMEQMTGSNIDITKVEMTLRFLNADGSVIYEKTHTYESVTTELEAAEPATAE